MRAALAAAAGLAAVLAFSGYAQAQSTGRRTQPVMRAPAPSATATPIPIAAPTALPYPAYGTPAPAVAARVVQPGIPQTVTLDQAVAIAAAESPVFASARAVLAQAKAPLDLAHTAIFPNLSGTVSTNRSNGTASFAGRSFGSGYTSNALSANLRQLIYDGGRVIAQIHQARANYNAAEGTFERSYETLAYGVATAYYNALQAQATTRLATQVVQQDQVQLNLVQAQLRAGTASKVDVMTAEVPLAQARVALVRDQGAELQADGAFANALGLDPNVLVQPENSAASNRAATLLMQIPVSYAKAAAQAMLMRPDYLAAQHTVQAEQYNLTYQSLGNMPSLNGTASLSTSSTNPNGGDFRPSNAVGLSLSIPIFDQGITHAQTELARAQLAQGEAQLRSTKLTVELNVQQALANYVSAQAALTQTQAELRNAQTVLSATQAQYRAGVTTLPLLLNAEVGLTTAQNDQLTAIYSLRQAEQAYLYSLGENAP